MSVVHDIPTVTVERVMTPYESGQIEPYEPGKEDLIRRVFRYDPATMHFSLHTQEYLWYDPSGYVTSGPF
jgi:hypothetical protein